MRLHGKISARPAGIPATQAENLNLPRNSDCQASPASRADTFSSPHFASEQNRSPESQYFSFHITHKGIYQSEKLHKTENNTQK